jgi:hypothetical protein
VGYRMGRGDLTHGYPMGRGDPGFFSFIGNALKTVAKIGGSAILGTLTGGPLGGIGAAIKSTISTTSSNIGQATLEAGGSQSALTPAIVAAHKAAVARGAAGGALALPGGAPMITAAAGGGGGHKQSARHLHALAMGLSRAKPRMQVTNTRALRRALRRAHGFARLAMRTIHLVHPKKKGRFGGFKKKRRAA